MLPSKRLSARLRDSSRLTSPNLAGISPEKLLALKSKTLRFGISARDSGTVPTSKFNDKLRYVRLRHVEISGGSVELMELSNMES